MRSGGGTESPVHRLCVLVKRPEAQKQQGGEGEAFSGCLRFQILAVVCQVWCCCFSFRTHCLPWAEKAVAAHSLENPMDGGAWKAAVHGVAKSRIRLSAFTFTFHFPALEKEMATHSSVLAWRIPGTGEPGGLPSLGSHRVRHDWSNLAAAAAAAVFLGILPTQEFKVWFCLWARVGD